MGVNQVQPYDEADIDGDDLIIRRIIPKHHLVLDNNTGKKKISTQAFSTSSRDQGRGMSVDILKLIEQKGENARQFVTNPRFTCSVTFPAKAAREVKLRIGYEPIEGNPYHGEVWPSTDEAANFTKGQKRALVKASEWFVPYKDED